MNIYPAIDLRGGKVVRLREGDPLQQTIFSNDPLAAAQRWIDQGARWIHMVNLDGAFDQANENLRILEAVAMLDVNVQFAGGLRDMESVRSARDAGANRIFIGTMAATNPASASLVLECFGSDVVGVALDARDGKVTTHGWTAATSLTPVELGKKYRALGARHALFTDVARDGGLSGVNVADTVALAQATGLQVIASGGVRDLSDILKLARSKAVAGAIIGMALYQRRFTLADALKAAKGG